MLGDADAALLHAKNARQMVEKGDRSNDSTLLLLTDIEGLLCTAIGLKQQNDTAEHHGKQCLMFARLIKGKIRINKECLALHLFAAVRSDQSRLPEAIDIAEKAYVLVSEAYGPVHRDVQNAASELISYLIANGNYYRPDDYCRMNYENLTDPRNGAIRRVMKLPVP